MTEAKRRNKAGESQISRYKSVRIRTNGITKGDERMAEAAVKLIKVKTMVTLVMTGVFAYLCCTGKVGVSDFMTIFTVIISFYFGTQHEKSAQTKTGDEN